MAERSLYLECASGISGDMFVGALLGLGADPDKLVKALDSMEVDGASVVISHVKRNELDAVDFDVILDKEHDGHDHDMEYLYGHLHRSNHTEHHHEEHHYDDHHDHSHEHDHHHEHGERHLSEVYAVIDRADITDNARALAKRIFGILAEAEGRVHGVPSEAVHFHEVGAVDSIMDVVAAAVCFDDLGVKKVYVETLREGRGTVRSRHGILPIPVPAVSAILEDHGLPIRFLNAEGEFITPTGAAIAAAITTDRQLPGRFTIAKTGIGSGKRKHEIPGILRAFLIEEIKDKEQDIIWKLEANMDDCPGEQLGYLMERLFSAGARDVHYSPCYMKKNRPATQLNVICDVDKLEELETIIFLESTTIGIRRIPVYRSVLPRKIITVKTPYGDGDVKVCSMPDGSQRVYPEFESVKKLAVSSGKSYEEIYQMMKEFKGM